MTEEARYGRAVVVGLLGLHVLSIGGAFAIAAVSHSDSNVELIVFLLRSPLWQWVIVIPVAIGLLNRQHTVAAWRLLSLALAGFAIWQGVTANLGFPFR